LASFSDVASGNSVLAGYRTLLSELRQDASTRARSAKSSDTSLFERTERQVLSLGQGSFSLADIDAARQRIEGFDAPNPETDFSPHPPATFEGCDIDTWLHTTRANTPRRQLSFVEMQISPGDISASPPTPSSVGTAPAEPGPNSLPSFTGTLQTKVLASDWKVCVITRPWLQEPILERLRSNIDPFVDTRELFGTGGALAAVPFALIVAKEVTVEISFSDRSAFENVRNAVANGQSVQIQNGASRLIVDGAVALFEDNRNSIVIPAVSGTAQIMFVVSKLY
jgi:hypothetical protein